MSQLRILCAMAMSWCLHLALGMQCNATLSRCPWRALDAVADAGSRSTVSVQRGHRNPLTLTSPERSLRLRELVRIQDNRSDGFIPRHAAAAVVALLHGRAGQSTLKYVQA